MSLKSKGLNAERELIHEFWRHNWAAIRVAGSGSIKYPVPDILAGNNLRKISIECKATTLDKQYLTKKEVEELIEFSKMFGCEAWIAIRFPGKKWFFFNPEDLYDSGQSFSMSFENAQLRGLSFDDLVNN